MNWHPKISEADNFPDKLEDGLIYSLNRIIEFTSESQAVQVFPEVKICHGNFLSVPWGQAFKGDDCWEEDRQTAYRAENGENKTPMISAYRDSNFEHSGTFVLLVHWINCEFYIEAISDATPIVSVCQARSDQMIRATLLALLILSRCRISLVPSVGYYKQPNMASNVFKSSMFHVKDEYSREESPFRLTIEQEPILIDIAKQIFNREHPEAYLASLRLMRAINRLEPDDSVVDLVISLEALFNGTKESGITQRVSQRLSHILCQPKAERRITLQIVKEAYAMRSNLVHGTQRQIGFLEDILGHSVTKGRRVVKDGDLLEIKKKLLSLVSSALMVRYTDHKSLSQTDLFRLLDDRAV